MNLKQYRSINLSKFAKQLKHVHKSTFIMNTNLDKNQILGLETRLP